MECKVANYLCESISELKYVTTTKNLFDKNKAVLNSEFSDGNLLSNNDWFVSDYINISGMYHVTISGKTAGSETWFYDGNKQSITVVYAVTGTISVPSGAVYIRFNAPKTDIDTTQVEEGTNATEYMPYKHIAFR